MERKELVDGQRIVDGGKYVKSSTHGLGVGACVLVPPVRMGPHG